MGYIKEITIGSGTANLIEPILYGTTKTAAGTQTKDVSISNFELVTGVTIAVKFTVTNTHATPKLNINSTGAKSIKYRGENLPSAATLTANRVYQFVYDGTNWELIGDLDTNTQTITGVKGNAESSYRTGQVNLTAANIGAIAKDETGNTQHLVRPAGLNGVNDVTYQTLINDVRANRLAFLPADQIIIEKTIDGGATWTDAGYTDAQKQNLFSEKRQSILIPQINDEMNINCGLRVTITGMKYNVPDNTSETQKYNYWNSNYVTSTERYCQIKNMYFWVSSAYNSIKVKVERATGAASTNWVAAFDKDDYGMTGWSGNDIISFSQANFGGSKNQTGNYWNWRFTFMTRGPGGSTTLDSRSLNAVQSINEIRGYGDTWWAKANEYMASDHLYSWDHSQNAIFPASIIPKVNNTKNLGNSSYKWANVYATTFIGNLTGNASGTATNVTGTVAIGNGGTGATTAATARSNLGLGNVDNTADADKTVKYANMLTGFTSRASNFTWGNQTGTAITVMNDSTGGSVGFRRDNPASGQMSMSIDGTIYIKEGGVNIGDAVKSFVVSGTTVTYTTLWDNTGTFTTQDTKNTAGSTNSTSKLFLIGATTQATNPTTNSYQYTYTNNGLLSALKVGLNLNGTEKAHLEWNNTDQSIDFVFN